MSYEAAADRYAGFHDESAGGMRYRFTGRSGLRLPLLSLGLWQNFGDDRPEETQRAILRRAFDRGVTHFDLANNYGPPYGRAEENFGRYLAQDLKPYRDELVISTKAGYDMWPGPYGQGGGSRKYVLASLDQSLARMGLDHVDIFYSHRFDADTPLEETMTALDTRRTLRPRAVRRYQLLLAGADPRGSLDRPRPGHPAADPPAVVLDAQPLDRGGPARRARGAGDGLHRLHRAGAGTADRPLPRRRPRRLARGPGRLDADGARGRRARPGAGTERDRASGAARSSRSSRCSGRCAIRG